MKKTTAQQTITAFKTKHIIIAGIIKTPATQGELTLWNWLAGKEWAKVPASDLAWSWDNFAAEGHDSNSDREGQLAWMLV